MPSVKRRSKYAQVWSGIWEDLPRAWDLACCDCGLIHGIEVRVHYGEPQIRMTVNKRATASYRRRNTLPFKPRSKPRAKGKNPKRPTRKTR